MSLGRFFQGTNHLQQWLSPVLAHAGGDDPGPGAVHQSPVSFGQVEIYKEYITGHTPGWYVWMYAAGTLAAIAGVILARRWKTGPADATVAPLQGFAATITFIFDRVYEVLIIRPLGVLAGICQLFIETAVIKPSLMSSAIWCARRFGVSADPTFSTVQ